MYVCSGHYFDHLLFDEIKVQRYLSPEMQRAKVLNNYLWATSENLSKLENLV